MAKYLVTGGSGFLGINLVRFLLAKGQAVRVLDLAPFNYPELNQIEFIKGDIRDKKTAQAAVIGVDIVVHSAAALPLYSKQDIFSTEVAGTRVMLEATHQAGLKRFVHISSTAVYGVPDHHPLIETDELIGVGPYGQAKIEAEKICLEFRAKGLVVPILRPKSFIGPERLGVFALLFDWAKSGHNFPLLGNGSNRYQLLDVEDLCEAIYQASILPPELVNDTFNIGAKEFKTMREDYQAVLDQAGFGKRIIGLPAKPAILLLKFLESLKLSPLYAWVYETAAKDSFVSIKKAEEKLNFQPKFSNQDALIRNFKWYLANEEKFKKESGISHRVPWKQGILKLAKLIF